MWSAAEQLIDSPDLDALRILLIRVHCTTYRFGKLALNLEPGLTQLPTNLIRTLEVAGF